MIFQYKIHFLTQPQLQPFKSFHSTYSFIKINLHICSSSFLNIIWILPISPTPIVLLFPFRSLYLLSIFLKVSSLTFHVSSFFIVIKSQHKCHLFWEAFHDHPLQCLVISLITHNTMCSGYLFTCLLAYHLSCLLKHKIHKDEFSYLAPHFIPSY